jgi:hypothetical protein
VADAGTIVGHHQYYWNGDGGVLRGFFVPLK